MKTKKITTQEVQEIFDVLSKSSSLGVSYWMVYNLINKLNTLPESNEDELLSQLEIKDKRIAKLQDEKWELNILVAEEAVRENW